MLRYKSTTIISDIKDFFTSDEKAVNSLITLLQSVSFSLSDIFKSVDKNNSQYSGMQKLIILLFFLFFEIKNSSVYQKSSLYNVFSGGKDLFYRMLNNPNMSWRRLLYRINIRLLKKVEIHSTVSQSERCLIVDDTDLPKTGKCMELIGKVFSHVTHVYKLGFKGLFLGYHDGTCFTGLDFSLHGEKGKNKKRPYGLTKKELKKRYAKKRKKDSSGYQRKEEYFENKIDRTITMVRQAIRKGIRFDYLLVDSWFTCSKIIQFIKTRHVICHFLGMIKMGKTKYQYSAKEMTSKEIASDLSRKKKVKHSKKLNCWYSEIIVEYKGYKVKLFFCRASKRASWNALLTTNLNLNFEEAYRIYSKRWTIEVFFKECKQYLNLCKCQSQDFDAQIATISICILQYNLLSVVKRFEGYETWGELFRAVQADTLELTVCERIWKIIIELLSELADFFETELEILMEKIFSENERFTKLLKSNFIVLDT